MNRRSRRRRANKHLNRSTESSVPLRYYAKPRAILKPNSPRFQSNHQRNVRASFNDQSCEQVQQQQIYQEQSYSPPHFQPHPPPIETPIINIVPPSDPYPLSARRFSSNCAPSNLGSFFDINLSKANVEKGLYLKKTCTLCNKCFSFNDLTILTCGHIFHSECLMDLRKNSNPRNHTCPTCRQLYHFFEIKAKDAYPHVAAVLIQKHFRGFIFRQRLGEIAPNGSTMHKKWVLSRAKTASILLVDAIETQSDAVDAILASIDKELDWARNVMNAVDVQEREINWENVKQKIVARGCGSCPICLREVEFNDCMMTSCEHFFHTECLKQWLSVCQHQNTATTCPVCRSPFQFRRLFEPSKLDFITIYKDNMTREEFVNCIKSDFYEDSQ
ncbi:hypothetical protein M9Y10_044135 [Tritrichomonas musculus]|uniref:RING-type domain-containing protein n=1 Tax=Tritrichomonas musculus TaxID=1915356 RepID=A0ABR2K1N4_9EUKA